MCIRYNVELHGLYGTCDNHLGTLVVCGDRILAPVFGGLSHYVRHPRASQAVTLAASESNHLVIIGRYQGFNFNRVCILTRQPHILEVLTAYILLYIVKSTNYLILGIQSKLCARSVGAFSARHRTPPYNALSFCSASCSSIHRLQWILQRPVTHSNS